MFPPCFFPQGFTSKYHRNRSKIITKKRVLCQMPINPSPRRARRLKRRFSSASIGSSWVGTSSPPLLSAPSSTSRPEAFATPISSADSQSRGLPTQPNELDISEIDRLFFASRGRSSNSPFGRNDRTFPRMSESRPMVYTSLPPTPISPSPPSRPSSPLSPQSPTSPTSSYFAPSAAPVPPFSLWDYLREELLATDFDSHQELKWERVSNFLSIPLAIEKVSLFLLKVYVTLTCFKIIGFGFILCLDSFLYTFTILPIRSMLAFFRFVANLFSSSAPPLPPSQKADLLRILLLIISVVILNPLTDASKIYHSIRGQDTIKLYVIFNALEVRLSTNLPSKLYVSDPRCILSY